MAIYKNCILIALLYVTALTSGTNGNEELNYNSNELEQVQGPEESLPYAIPDHEYNENFEHDLDELSLEIRKKAVKKGIINKNSAPPFEVLLNDESQEIITTPQGIAINGKELDLTDRINAIALTQSKIASNFQIYKPILHHQGVWDFIDINKINFTGKRVALVVHGHNTTSLLDALSTYCHTKIKNLLFWVKPQEISATKPNYHYGLDTLVNLGRMLYQDIYDKNKKPRYDYVIGYAYSSWGEIKQLAQQFTKDINSSGLKKAQAVELFAHSMGGVMTRWSLEQEGLGEWIHNCVFIASPHQGVPFCLNIFGNSNPNRKELIAITPKPLISTTDLITRNLDLDNYASDFIKELTFTKSPHVQVANYHTLAGYQYDTLIWSALKEGEMPKSYDLCPGTVVQKYLDCRFGKGKIVSDGLVPIYSATSEYLINKSHRYGRTEDYQHSIILPLDHRTLTGDDLQPTLFNIEQKDTPYKMVLHTLKNWIQYWPD